MRRWAIAALAGISLWGTVAAAHADDVVSVNGSSITDADVEKAFKRTRFAQQKIPPEREKILRDRIVEILIDDRLVDQFLAEKQAPVDEAKVEEHIAGMEKKLAASGRTLADFLAQADITDEEMRQDLHGIYRWLGYVDSQATPETLRKYFDANRAAFDGSQVRASHILVRVPEGADEAQWQAARDKTTAIRAQLAAGVDFADAARQNSDCPSKDQGGDLDFFPRKGLMTEPFAAAAFALDKGEVSQIVETEFGCHLILVTDKKPGTPVNFDEVADQVKAIYAQELRQAVVAQQKAAAKIEHLRR